MTHQSTPKTVPTHTFHGAALPHSQKAPLSSTPTGPVISQTLNSKKWIKNTFSTQLHIFKKLWQNNYCKTSQVVIVHFLLCSQVPAPVWTEEKQQPQLQNLLKFQILDNQEIEGRLVPVQCGHHAVWEKCLMFLLRLTVTGCSGCVMNSRGNKRLKAHINPNNKVNSKVKIIYIYTSLASYVDVTCQGTLRNVSLTACAHHRHTSIRLELNLRKVLVWRRHTLLIFSFHSGTRRVSRLNNLSRRDSRAPVQLHQLRSATRGGTNPRTDLITKLLQNNLQNKKSH